MKKEGGCSVRSFRKFLMFEYTCGEVLRRAAEELRRNAPQEEWSKHASGGGWKQAVTRTTWHTGCAECGTCVQPCWKMKYPVVRS